MTTLQLTQNNLLRMLNKTKVADKVSISSMLNKFGLLSVNQLAAQIKLTEVWKLINVENCPLNLEPFNPNLNQGELSHNLRPKQTKTFKDTARLRVSKCSFNIDAAKIWNVAPSDIQKATTLSSAKTAIKKFCLTLPV